MDRILCEKFLNKNVKIDIFSSDYYYKGMILEVTNTGLVIDTISGMVALSLADIRNIREVE